MTKAGIFVLSKQCFMVKPQALFTNFCVDWFNLPTPNMIRVNLLALLIQN